MDDLPCIEYADQMTVPLSCLVYTQYVSDCERMLLLVISGIIARIKVEPTADCHGLFVDVHISR